MTQDQLTATAIILRNLAGRDWTAAARIRYWLVRAGFDRPVWLPELLDRMVDEGTLERRRILMEQYRLVK